MLPIRLLRALLTVILAAAMATAVAAPTALRAQDVPADDVLRDFKINGDFIFELGGEVRKEAGVFFSERAVAYLVMGPPLESPILISPRSQAVERVPADKVRKSESGTLDLLADAVLEPVGSFQLKQSHVVFSIDGEPARLLPRPWLLGRHTGERLLEHNPEYAYEAGRYVPQGDSVEWLRGQGRDVRVRVYFGSWCPRCKELLPRILRLAGELEGSKIRFEYYGFPKPFGTDPEAFKVGIRTVPTAVIFVDGQEARRLDGAALAAPETALRGALSPASGAS